MSIIKNDGETTAHNDFTDRTIFNPSSVLHKKEQNEFVVDLPNKVLYFDTKQLDSGGDVTFELKAK